MSKRVSGISSSCLSGTEVPGSVKQSPLKRTKNRLWGLLAALLLLAALPLLWAVTQPYEVLKPLADSLTSDGNFNSLKQANVGTFKALFASGGLILLAAAYATAFQRKIWRYIGSLAGRFASDFRRFWGSARPQSSDRWYLLILALITVPAIIFRLERIYAPLIHDEAYTRL